MAGVLRLELRPVVLETIMLTIDTIPLSDLIIITQKKNNVQEKNEKNIDFIKKILYNIYIWGCIWLSTVFQKYV